MPRSGLRSKALVEGGNPTCLRDDLARRPACSGPISELLDGPARAVLRQHQPDEPRQWVPQVLDLAGDARDRVDLDVLDARALPREAGIADRVVVLLDRVDDQPVG